MMIDPKPYPVSFVILNRDVKQGQRGKCFGCPAALAILRRLPPGYRAGVTEHGILFSRVQDHHVSFPVARAHCPASLTNFIVQFDSTGRAARLIPFRFTLKIQFEPTPFGNELRDKLLANPGPRDKPVMGL